MSEEKTISSGGENTKHTALITASVVIIMHLINNKKRVKSFEEKLRSKYFINYLFMRLQLTQLITKCSIF